MSVCVRCVVEGKVQGVFFRQSTMRIAQAFGASGWVRNCDDGSVEVMACGEQAEVDKLRDWLTQGPVTAEVSQVTCEPVDYQSFEDFEVRY